MITTSISALVALSALSASASGASSDDKPNIILIVCDNLGYGDIAPFGSKLHRTPNLDRMAEEGRKFTHFNVTAGVCTPSRASIMTGCYAQRVHMHTNPRDGHVLRPVSPYGLHPDEITVAEVLKGGGYATACIGKWHLGDQPAFLPTRQGFDDFFGIPYSDDMTEAMGKRLGERFEGKFWPPLPLMDGEKVVDAPADRDHLTRRYTERALGFIRENRGRPFFLYFPQAMPGSTSTPYAGPAFKGKSANGPWGDSVEELDWSTGEILDCLEELGIEKRTLVIWTSDNGAPLARDISEPTRGSNAPLHGRGYTTAEGAYRVPTIAWWPGVIPAGTVCEELATTMDLLPTFAALAGVERPEDRKIDGHDIRALLVGKERAKTPYDFFFYYQRDHLQAVRSGPWKLFLPAKGASSRHPHFMTGRDGGALLFHLYDDVSCEKDVSKANPEVVAKLFEYASVARRELGDRGKRGAGQRKIGEVPNPKPRVR